MMICFQKLDDWLRSIDTSLTDGNSRSAQF